MKSVPGSRSIAALTWPTMAVGAVALALAACASPRQGASPGASSTVASPRPTVVSHYSPCALSFPGTPVGRALANLYAGSLLCEFAVPPRARRLASAPDAGHGFLDQSLPQTGIPDQVSRAEFWQVPGSPQDVLAWEKRQMPHALADNGPGSGSLRGVAIEWQADYTLPAVPAQPSVSGQISSRTMSLFAVKAGNGRTDIEVVASVEWIPPRAASEVVPPGVRAITIAAVPDMNLHSTPPAPVTVTDPAQVRRIVALIDALPLSPPGVFSCPFDADAEVVLTFRARGAGGPVLAVADQGLEGCEWTSLTIGGKQQPSLGAPSGGRSAAAEVLRIAGLSWNLSKLVM
jgi:hypothetical protein